MSNVRVYELAKKLGVDHTVVEQRCRELGIKVDGHLAQLTGEDAERVQRALEENPGGEVTEKRVRKTVIRRRRQGERPSRGAETEEKVATARPEARVERPAGPAGPRVARPADAPRTPAAPAAERPAERAPASPPAEQAAAAAAPVEAPVAAREAAEVAAPAGPAPEAPPALAAEAGKAAPASAETAYTGETPVNVPGEADEKRQSYVQVVGRIDPAVLERARRPSGPPDRGPRRPPAPGPPPGPGGRPQPTFNVNAPLADRRNKPGAATDDKRKRRRGGRVAYDRDKDVAFDDRLGKGRGRGRRTTKKGRKPGAGGTEITIPKASKRVVKMDETVTVGELASQLSVKAGEIIKYMMGMGEMVTVNHVLDLDTVKIIADEYNFTVENVAFNIENFIPQVDEEQGSHIERDPVVTVMGHVDHGKTSLLDYIRKSRVAAGEAGGITQHIGAYKVPVTVAGEEKQLVFLDTPGHAAFTQMRARGAQVTDVVILVVAADDGVMPQTVEAINHSRAAGVPIVVAINKIDKPDADPKRVMTGLTEHGLVSEEWGGDVQMIEVSAKTGDGIDDLLESVYLQSEMIDLDAVADCPASGVVIEAELSRGRGPVATVLVQQGTLRRGDIVVAGQATGRVRALVDDKGRQVAEAGPSTPVEILGLDQVPPPSERFYIVKDEKDAKQIVSYLSDKEREKRLAGERRRVSLEDLNALAADGAVKSLHIIIKSDVQGSLEALRSAFADFRHAEVEVRIIHGAVGPISESDVTLAAASDAIILGFNVRPEKTAKALAEQEGVEIRLYSVIYNALDDVKAAMEGLLSPVIEENFLGKAEIREVFKLTGQGTIAGCAVLQGKLVRNGHARLIRDNVVIYDGRIESLRRFKENVAEVDRGHECGARLENYQDLKVGDEIECYEKVEVAQKLEL